MSTKTYLVGLAVSALTLLSCHGGASHAEDVDDAIGTEDYQQVDSLEEDAQGEESMLKEESDPRLDAVFDDFLFAFLHNPRFRKNRIAKPLRLEHPSRPTETLDSFDSDFEFAFLSGDFLTSLYGSNAEMQDADEGILADDTLISVQRINLNDGTVRHFKFWRKEGHWQLFTIREGSFDEDGELNDFLRFYAKFCKDSTTQTQYISNPLRIAIQDPDDDEGCIDGTIDANQWHSFCPEVPSGIISNIQREGQRYNSRKMILRKSGLSNGMQEVFSFTRERDNWRLNRYEN